MSADDRHGAGSLRRPSRGGALSRAVQRFEALGVVRESAIAAVATTRRLVPKQVADQIAQADSGSPHQRLSIPVRVSRSRDQLGDPR